MASSYSDIICDILCNYTYSSVPIWGLIMDDNTEVIILGGGCFWCLEAALKTLEGVKNATSGYMGGKTEKPTYSDVCSGSTGHAEVVKVEFTEEILNIDALLSFFFHIHDASTLNKQGADVGTQYRSIIFCLTNQQKESTLRIIEEMEKTIYSGTSIVTEVNLVPPKNDYPTIRERNSSVFWKAEDYHQNYFAQNPGVPYCQAVVLPKLEKARELKEKLNLNK